MTENWDNEIKNFIHLCDKEGVRMLMVGGGAVNFHGYQRHSADVDFWLETTPENFKRLVNVFSGMGYDIDDFPQNVKNQYQNISVKFSPASMEVELITKFSVNKPFDEAYRQGIEASLVDDASVKWKVLNLEDLITSKVKSGRPKDLLDIQQLRDIRK
jgi:predicted nucleotidyltransferase